MVETVAASAALLARRPAVPAWVAPSSSPRRAGSSLSDASAAAGAELGRLLQSVAASPRDAGMGAYLPHAVAAFARAAGVAAAAASSSSPSSSSGGGGGGASRPAAVPPLASAAAASVARPGAAAAFGALSPAQAQHVHAMLGVAAPRGPSSSGPLGPGSGLLLLGAAARVLAAPPAAPSAPPAALAASSRAALAELRAAWETEYRHTGKV